jgi:nucleotide-binding universal stress UspA family protein
MRGQKLLLATDCSRFSDGAVREAIRLAGTFGGKLAVIAVVETNPEYETLAPKLLEKAEREVKERLESVRSRAQGEGIDCEIIARHAEEPYRPIVEEAAEREVDMIVMGRRGRTGLDRLLMGSVAAKVIGHSPCNVLVVPESATLRFESIVVATDGSRFSEEAVRDAVSIAGQSGGKLTALSVVPSESASPFDIVHSDMQHEMISRSELQEARKALEDIAAVASGEGVAVESHLAAGRPYEAILEAAREKGADLIVVGSHGRTGLERLLMGSVTERVVGHADCAVLIVKCRRKS